MYQILRICKAPIRRCAKLIDPTQTNSSVYFHIIQMQKRRSDITNETYHVLFIGKYQDNTVEHKWIFDDGLKEN
jgi:hypothetical protein